MRRFVILLVFVSIGIASVSCDGRDRVYKTNTEILKENKLLDSFSESITYIPRNYTQVETDTILSNGFRIKIETYSDMDQGVLNTVTTDAIVHKKYYREFKSNIIVYKDDKKILSTQIDKSLFSNKFNNLYPSMENLVLSSVRVDQGIQDKKDETKIDINYYNPITDYYFNFKIIVNDSGEYNILNSQT